MEQSRGLMTPRPWLLLLIGMVVLSPILYAIDYSSVQRKGPPRSLKLAPQQLQPQQRLESAPQQLQPQQRLKPAPQQLQPQHRLSCDNKLKQTSGTDSPKLLVVAAAPGSGSDWTRLIFTRLTGLGTIGFNAAKKLKKISQLRSKVRYYKSHYPFQSIEGEIQAHQHEHPDRLVVLLRDPFDAAFSEYTRKTQDHRNKKRITSKYSNLDLLTIDDYLAVDNSSGKRNIPSEAIVAHFKDYLEHWKFFHQHWLEVYKGSLKLYLYKDLVQNNLLFLDMANYFGFGAGTNIQKEHQEQCLLQYMKKASEGRRPHSEFLDNAKMILKEYFTDDCLEAKTYVEELLKRKYKKDIIIN